ncbi:hypothetical protein [Novosphingobium sp.]|uniref:hypothetical protein n=1 Tax=Novosphingobium sp. TaxID=1874826 RepID=UPI002FE1B98F
MTKFATPLSRAALVIGLLAGPTTAFAQGTWSLPPGQQEGQSAPRSQGPVDPQNPSVTPRDSAPDAPAATPSARPTPVPTIVAPPPPAVRATERPQPRATTAPAPVPSATPARPAEAPRAEATTAAAPSSAVTPSPAPVPLPAPAATGETVAPQATPSAAPETPAQPASALPAATPHWPEWWLAIPAALVGVGIGVFALLRRRRAPATAWEEAGLEPEAEPEDEIADEATDIPPSVTAAAAVAALDPVPAVSPIPRVQPLRNPEPQAPRPAPPQTPIPAPTPAPSGPGVIAVHFEPVSLRLSLVYATLQYRLTLAAPETGLPQPWRVLGDMISAHASLSQGEQLAPDPATLPLRHTLEALAPGETREFKGELQLPLNAIRVMRQGQASLFVPLVRLCLADEQGHVERRVFTLGVPGEGSGLAPIRLDTGPRDHAAIAVREIEAARTMGRDPNSPIAA